MRLCQIENIERARIIRGCHKTAFRIIRITTKRETFAAAFPNRANVLNAT